jgi:hypothetical protein
VSDSGPADICTDPLRGRGNTVVLLARNFAAAARLAAMRARKWSRSTIGMEAGS